MPTTRPGPGDRLGLNLRPPPIERLDHLLRRWWRSRGRYRGLRFWLTTRGLPIVVILAGIYVVNGIIIGWREAYDVAIHITSLIRNSGRHQHHCRSRTRWPEFLIRLNVSSRHDEPGRGLGSIALRLANSARSGRSRCRLRCQQFDLLAPSDASNRVV